MCYRNRTFHLLPTVLVTRDSRAPAVPRTFVAPIAPTITRTATTLRALHIEPMPQWIRGLFQKAADEAGIDMVWGGALDREELAGAAAGADALVTGQRRIGAELIRAGAGVRLVLVQGRAPWAVDREAAAAAGVPGGDAASPRRDRGCRADDGAHARSLPQGGPGPPRHP